VGLLLFSVSFGIATALSNGQVSVLAVAVEPVLEIVLSLGLGAIMGWLLNWVEQFFHSRSKRMTISVAFVLLTVGLSMLKFRIGPVHCGFSLLLVCMMTGTIFCNICDTSEELMNRVEGWTMPLNILFFVISGAELDLNVLVQPVTLLLGVIYIIARSAGKYFGSSLSCRLTRQPKPIVDNLGITLLPQAGVALGMALTASTLPGGALTRNVVLFAVLIYELVGPSLTKRSLMAVGDIRPEGRTSARTLNADKQEENQ
jgi:NhaP-type Na+/H+ or K+/H+ antiporter